MRRNFTLDVLRGLAIALVMFFHIGVPEEYGEDGDKLFHDAASVCWAGVDLFFVLSGFLISGLLFREIRETGTLDLKRFWLRRGLKIWPSYFVTYLGLLSLRTLNDLRLGETARAKANLLHSLPDLVFVQNYFPNQWRWPQSWSLAIEEHFYIGLPLVLALLVARSRRRGGAEPPTFPRFFAGGVAFLVLVLVARLVDAGTAVPYAYFRTHFRADSLAFGVVLGWLYHHRRPTFAKLARLWPLAVALTPIALWSMLWLGIPWPGYPPKPGQPPHSGNYWSAFTIGFNILYLAFGGLVIAAGEYPEAGLRAPLVIRAPMKALAFIGGYSYTIYLAQAVLVDLPAVGAMFRLARRILVDDNWVDRIGFVVLSVPLGIALSHVVERPALRVRERLWPSASKRAREERPATRAEAA
jgi:peptidoglycan/LPS O-acetylase OafA/YrhL